MTLLNQFIQKFPFPEIRESQRKVMEDIAYAFEDGKKFVVLEAPTGFGKSALAVAVGQGLGKSYYCTGTKDLQQQYLRDFPFIKKVVGRNNFECRWLVEKDVQSGEQVTLMFERGSKRFKPTAEEGECCVSSKTKCPYFIAKRKYMSGQTSKSGAVCDYYVQKYDGQKSFHTIYNYKYFLPNALYGRDFELRNITVFDECHELENQLKDYLTLTIDFERMDKMIKESYREGFDELRNLDVKHEKVLTTASWVGMAESIFADLSKYISEEKQDLEKQLGFSISFEDEQEQDFDDLDEDTMPAPKGNVMEAMEQQIKDAKPEDERKLRERIRRVNQADRQLQLVDKFLADFEMGKAWIVANVEYDKQSSKIGKITFTPVVVGSVARRMYEKTGYVLMMSATVLDYTAFCKSVGIREEEAKFISVGSDFPIENRLIECLNVAHLNYKQLQNEETVNKVVQAVDKIMSKHPNEKGIIHTTSKRQVSWILEGTNGHNGISKVNRDRILTTTLTEGDAIRREEVVQKHIDSPAPTVLLSPSMQTGLDLKDDLARFAILVKVPWPDLKDRWIEARRKVDPEWYIWQTGLKMIQAYGRTVRSKEDHAITYVLDTGFVDFCRRYKRILPKWFREAIRIHDNYVP